MYKVDLYPIVDKDGYSYQLSFIDNQGKNHERSGKVTIQATDNAKEIMAIISALKELKSRCKVIIHTERFYIANAINEWLAKWQQDKFINAKGEKIKNKELWEEYILLALNHEIEVLKENGN